MSSPNLICAAQVSLALLPGMIYFIYFNYTGQTVKHWFVQGDQPQEKDNYTNTVRLANYLNAYIHQLQMNQLIATQLDGGVKRSNLQLS